MRMDHVNTLPEDNGSQVRKEREEIWESRVGRYGRERDVVHFDARVEVTDTDVVGRVGVRHNDDFMTKSQELGGQHVYMALDTADSWVKEVGDHPARELTCQFAGGEVLRRQRTQCTVGES